MAGRFSFGRALGLSLAEGKAWLRAEALARRDALPVGARIEAALTVAERAADHLAIQPGTIVAGTLPIRSELDPRPLMAALATRGARLCVPALVSGEIEFRELLRGARLEPQGFGTYAPGSDAAVLRPAVLLVPLAAFDRRGHRLGYGRGFYDRALRRLDGELGPVFACGLAFAAQEVEAVPDEPHDRALDLVVTESGVLRPGRS